MILPLSRFRLSKRRTKARSSRRLRRPVLELGLLEGRVLLAGDMTAPATTAAVVGTLGLNGFYVSPVTVNFSATDPDDASATLTTFFSINGGAQSTGTSLKLTLDGIYSIAYHSTDPAGNVEATHTLIVSIDQTAPVVTIMADPSTLWPPNHKFRTVVVSGTATDNLSGLNKTLAWHVVDEYGKVQPSGTATLTLSGPLAGTYSFDVSLQSSRAGQDKDGRQYKIIVTASDLAGNTQTVSTIVTVPHDQGHHNGSSHHGGKGHGHGHVVVVQPSESDNDNQMIVILPTTSNQGGHHHHGDGGGDNGGGGGKHGHGHGRGHGGD